MAYDDELTWDDADDWPSQWFSPRELACKGSGALRIHIRSLERLTELRQRLGRPLHVVSGYRSPAHNAAVGGAPQSLHLQGRAFDLGYDTARLGFDIMDLGREVGFTGFGFYRTFIHLDTGAPRLWIG